MVCTSSVYLCNVRFTHFLALLLLQSTAGFAQRQHGLINDNYGGYNTLQFNPANLADSRFKYNMNVLVFNTNIQNNYLQVEAPHSLYKFLYFTLDSNFLQQNFDYPFEEYYVTERLNNNDKTAIVNAKVNVASMQFGLNDRSGVSLGFTTRVVANARNVSQAGIKTFLKNLDTLSEVKQHQKELIGQQITLDNSGFAGMGYQQYGAKYAFVANDKKRDFFKVGIGLDYNLGLFGGYFQGKDIDYTLTGVDTMALTSSELELAYIKEGFYTDESRRLNDFFGKSSLGRGFGVNVGFVYEKRNDYKKYRYKMNRKTHYDNSSNKYDWKLHASIVDLGFIRFENEDYARKISVSTSSDTLFWNDFDTVSRWKGTDDLDSFAASFFPGTTNDIRFTMFTPATLNIGGDYKINDNFYLAANYSQSLITSSGKGVKLPSVFHVAPRYEAKWFTASLPLSVSKYYNVFNLGAYVRAGIFYMGTDNLGGMFTGKKTNGYNLYAGFNWPIHYSKLEDMDGDGISDDLDKCPDFPGTRYTDGCPDGDGDKVADDEDLCPNEPGSKKAKGCPDYDNDGLAGTDDKCPDLYGSKNNEGCPDSDGDGIYDNKDKCPDQAGEEKYGGCPEEQAKDGDIGKKEEKEEDEKEPEYSNDGKPTKFDEWDFATYEYWPVLGAYNELRWAEELETRLNNKLNTKVTIRTMPGVSSYYVTLGKAASRQEALEIQKILDRPEVNDELNGKLWWKKVLK